MLWPLKVSAEGACGAPFAVKPTETEPPAGIVLVQEAGVSV